MKFLNTVWKDIKNGLTVPLGNLKGALVGGVAGYFIFKKYESGLLLQRQMSRAFTVLGVEHDMLIKMGLIIVITVFVGALLEYKFFRGKR